MKVIKKLLKGIVLLVLAIVVMIAVRGINDARIDYEVSTVGVDIPKYTAVDVPYDQGNDFTAAHPFAAGAVIDIDNDGVEELFLGGGPDQTDGLLRYHNGGFETIDNAAGITKTKGTSSFGASVIDTDGDGWDDLIVSRTDGVWLHRNQSGTFSSEKLALAIPDHTTPMSVGLVDINRDGHFDLYVAGYVRLDLVEGQNILTKKATVVAVTCSSTGVIIPLTILPTLPD